MISIVWLRRDLRLEDNAALYHALKSQYPVLPIFIFDTEILSKLDNRKDARVGFIFREILNLKKQLNDMGSDLRVYHGTPLDVWKNIVKNYNVKCVFTNRDYESYAIIRDKNIQNFLQSKGIQFNTHKDHVIFEVDEVLKSDGDPYVVFTPYKRTWLEKLNSRGQGPDSFYFKSYSTEKYFNHFYKTEREEMISLEEMGFERSEISIPSKDVSRKLIKEYHKNRDYPAVAGTSKLGVHFRFGTISIREKARKAFDLNETYLSELIWRDFYSSILQAFPRVENESFRQKYDGIEWRNNEEEFGKWCAGETGYPIVDAGMRELNTTGYMHNRVRMITASFLTKHLLIDWRWGEAYFAEKLLDYDLASNNGGWQWAAGCGTDAAPYFRIFNPTTQAEKFDKNKKYIREYIPEYGSEKYTGPMVDHKEARERCLSTYKKAL